MPWWQEVLRACADILGSLFIQLVFTVGFFMLYGGFISLCNRYFYDACGERAFWLVRLTGYIGTPVHELSHALMCLLFGHSVQKICLFGDSRDSKTLGYVEHTYYKSNLYHQIGNFFIGISPILAGGAVILLLIRFLTPGLFWDMRNETVSIGAAFAEGALGEALLALFDGLFSIVVSLFSVKNLVDWRWWVCMLLVFPIALHMEVSRSDIRSGVKGLAVISALLFLTDVILGWLFPDALLAVTEACVSAGIFMALFMMIPAVFSALIGLVSWIRVLTREAGRSIRNDVAPVTNCRTVHDHKKIEQKKKNR